MADSITHFVGGATESVAARLADRAVRFVLGTAVDFSGVTRAKAVPVERLQVFVEPGIGASPSWLVFCADFGIAFIPGLGVTGDLRLRIDPARTTVIDDGVAWAPAEFFGQDGERFAGCARWALSRVITRLAGIGLTAWTGAEVEFVLTRPDGSQRVRGPWQGYGVRSVLDVAPLLQDLTENFAGAGVPIEQLHAEYGADQFEVSLPPADPVTTADRTVLARILIGRAAARHGFGASFSPVPFEGGAGNGAHLHLSLASADGPLLSGGDGPHGLTAQGGSAIAGVVAGLPELQAILAGSVVSPVRLKPGNWAGAFACWGLENREAGVRLIADTPGNPHGASVELKIIDGSANPYLAATAFLGLALDGIERDLPLPREVTVDPADLSEKQRVDMALAADQQTALGAFERSSLARELFGDMIVDGTLAVRRYEQRTYGGASAEDVASVFRLAFSC